MVCSSGNEGFSLRELARPHDGDVKSPVTQEDSCGMWRGCLLPQLLAYKSYSLRQGRPRGAVAVDDVVMLWIAERNAADDALVVGELQIVAHHVGTPGKRGLRDRADAERQRRQHEITHIGAAVDGAVD